jgi:hypothetical protein
MLLKRGLKICETVLGIAVFVPLRSQAAIVAHALRAILDPGLRPEKTGAG